MPLTVTLSDLTFIVFEEFATSWRPSTVVVEFIVLRLLKLLSPMFQLLDCAVAVVELLLDELLDEELLDEELLELLDELLSLESTCIL